MKLIVCLDDKHGMLFHKRRQSMDRELCRRVLSMTEGRTLWMNEYSRPLFDGMGGNIRVDACFLEHAGKGEYCFVENTDVSPYVAGAEEIILYRWNRVYPSDMRFPMHLLAGNWTVSERMDFAGNSHEKITQEAYRP